MKLTNMCELWQKYCSQQDQRVCDMSSESEEIRNEHFMALS